MGSSQESSCHFLDPTSKRLPSRYKLISMASILKPFTCIYRHVSTFLKQTHLGETYYLLGGFPGDSAVKNLPAVQETRGLGFDP